jgi:hypothetical protein
MAFTITKSKIGVAGDLRYVIGTLAFDSSYGTGGESLAPADVGLMKFYDVRIHQTAGYAFAFDYTNNKVLAYWAPALSHTHALSIPLLTVTGLTQLSATALGATVSAAVAGVTSATTTVGGVLSATVTQVALAEVTASTDLSTALSSVPFMVWGA